MHGRRLATTDKIIVLTSPDSGEPLDRLQDWAAEKGIDVAVVELGEEIECHTPLSVPR